MAVVVDLLKYDKVQSSLPVGSSRAVHTFTSCLYQLWTYVTWQLVRKWNVPFF